MTPPPFGVPSALMGCGHGGSLANAVRSPGHLSSRCGAFQRNWPTGGFANGTPRKTFTPSSTSPTSTPLSIVALTVSRVGAFVWAWVLAATDAANANVIRYRFMIPPRFWLFTI